MRTAIRRGFSASLPVLLALGVGWATAAGCIGRIGDSSSDGTFGPPPGSDLEAQCASATPDTEPVIVRMLNRREYKNTIRDLVHVPTDIVEDFPLDAIVGFDNVAESLVASSLLVEKHLDAAEEFAQNADLTDLVPCAAADECIDDFIATFGRRTFRRPVTDEEAGTLRALFDEARAKGRSVDAAARLVIEGFLMSPQFLYRAETTAAAEGGVEPVSAFEMASRLSYFVWASMPDDELLDAAEAGELSSDEQLDTQVRRMLADPKAHDVTTAFHALWLQLFKLESTSKDTTQYPDFEAVRPLFAEETVRFAEDVFWADASSAGDYLLSDRVFINDELGAFYGMSGASGSDFEAVSSGDQRFGLLTQGSVLAMFSNPDRTSPTRRGKFVRSQLLCQPPPAPPPNVPALAPEAESEGSLRERLAEHQKDPVCKSCHQLLDPVGFGLENYDTVGRYRTEEAGEPVDASGELLQVKEGGGGAFVGARELAEHLTATDEFYSCIATQWFRFAAGRLEGPRDACTVYGVEKQFRESGDRLPELIVAIAKSNAFVLKNTEQAQ